MAKIIPIKRAPWAIVFVICSIQFDFALVLSRVRAKILINAMPTKATEKNTEQGNEVTFAQNVPASKLSVPFFMPIAASKIPAVMV